MIGHLLISGISMIFMMIFKFSFALKFEINENQMFVYKVDNTAKKFQII